MKPTVVYCLTCGWAKPFKEIVGINMITSVLKKGCPNCHCDLSVDGKVKCDKNIEVID